MKVLVTGITGNIGRYLGPYFVKQGYEVHGLARFSRQARLKQAEEDLRQSGIVLWKKDLMTDSLDDMPDFDYVFHQMVVWGGRDDTPPGKMHGVLVNSRSVGRVMYRWRNAKAIMLASTGSVYAPTPEPVDEKALVVGGRPVYGAGKFAMEMVGDFCSIQFNTPAVILRYFWPRPSFEEMATETVQKVLKGEPIATRIYESKPWPMTPIDMEDLCNYTRRAAVEAASVPPEILNCGGPEIVSEEGLAKLAGEVLGKEPVLEPQETKMTPALSDSSALYERFGKPKHYLTEIVRRVAERARSAQ